MTNEQMIWTILGAMSGQTVIILMVIFKITNDLKDSLNKRIDDLKDLFQSEIKRLEEKIDHINSKRII